MRGMDLALARFATGTADDVYATMPGAEVGAVLATALDAADPGTRRVALAVIAQAVAAVCDDEDRGVLPDAVTANVAVPPAATAMFVGWLNNAGPRL